MAFCTATEEEVHKWANEEIQHAASIACKPKDTTG
jgi:hypothetical protein